MTIRKDGSNIDGVFYGSSKIEKIYKGSELVYQHVNKLPTSNTPPSSSTGTVVATATGANHTIYTVTQDGFYSVLVKGAGGGKGSAAAGQGGGRTAIVYLYKGTKCLLWGGSKGNNYSTTYGLTGYPSPTSALGGRGAQGSDESGGAGGGAATNGSYVHKDGGSGGAGAGFIAGIDKKVTSVSKTNSAWSKALNSTDGWSVGDFSVAHAYVFVLAGGGGGGSGNNGSRGGGCGGGAWGNGGDGWGSGATAGPGGTWGKGASGSKYSGGAAGAWAVLDFSRNVFEYGTGGGNGEATDGSCVLSRLNV